MRTTAVVTISLPLAMAKQTRLIAKKQQMTNSEFVRFALRRFIEEIDSAKAMEIYSAEKQGGKLKTLKGSLADLMG